MHELGFEKNINPVGTELLTYRFALAMDANGTLYAAGTEISGGIFQWDGQSWSSFGARHDGTIFDIVIDGAGQIYAAGDFISVN